MLSMKAKYGLRAALVLARQYGKGPVLISELATTQKIPKKFLEAILLDLKRRGILLSKKGKGGGYYLGKPPDLITIGELIRAVDGPIALLPCASKTAYRPCDDCPEPSTCGIRDVIKDVRDATARILDGTTLTDVLGRMPKLSPRVQTAMYHI